MKEAISDGVPLIRLAGVKKVFLTDEVETHALVDIDLDISKGDYVAIAGPSGCGKSTLMSILGLLDTPTEGTYTLKGRPVDRLSLAESARIRNREIGFIFQAFNLIGDLNVYENVELPLTYRGMGARQRREHVLGALERVSMEHRAKHYPAQLSGGAAATGRGGTGAGGRSGDLAGRRADGQPGLEERGGGHGTVG